MSLVSEALRKAKAEGTSAPGVHAVGTAGEVDDYGPVLTLCHGQPRKPRHSLAPVVAIGAVTAAFVLAVVLVATLGFRGAESSGPRDEAGDGPITAGLMTPAAPQAVEPTPVTETPSHAPQPAPATPLADALPIPAPAPVTVAAPPEPTVAPATQPAVTPAPAPTPEVAAPTPAVVTTPAPAPTPAPEPQPERPVLANGREYVQTFDAPGYEKLRLGGIIYSRGAAAATINSVLVREGDGIGDARIVRIEPRRVQLELEGKRFYLRMP